VCHAQITRETQRRILAILPVTIGRCQHESRLGYDLSSCEMKTSSSQYLKNKIIAVIEGT
jgi:hypothetical protein